MSTPASYQPRRGMPKRAASPRRGNPRWRRPANGRNSSNSTGFQTSYSTRGGSNASVARGGPRLAPRGQPASGRGQPRIYSAGEKREYHMKKEADEQQKFQETMSNWENYLAKVDGETPSTTEELARGQPVRGKGQPKLTPEEKLALKLKQEEEEQQKFQETLSKLENYRAKFEAATSAAEENEILSIDEWKKRKEESQMDPEEKRMNEEREERRRQFFLQQENQAEEHLLKLEQERKEAEEETKVLLLAGRDSNDEEESGSEREERKPQACEECGMKYREGPKKKYEQLIQDNKMIPNLYLTKEFIANLPQEPLSCRDVSTFILRERNDGFEQFDTVGNNLIDEVDRFLSEFKLEEDFEKIPSLEIVFSDEDLPKLRARDGSEPLRPILINGLKISDGSSLANQGGETIFMYPIIEMLLEMILMGHKTTVILPDFYECDVDDHVVFERLIELGLIQCLEDCGRNSYMEQLQKIADQIGAGVMHDPECDFDSFCTPPSEGDPKINELIKEGQLSLMDQVSLILELIPIINLDENLLHPVQLILRFALREGLLKEDMEDFLCRNPPFLPPSAYERNRSSSGSSDLLE